MMMILAQEMWHNDGNALMSVSQHNPTRTAKKSGLTYKMPDSRSATFGGVMRDDDGDIVDDNTESDVSSVMRDDLLPVDYVVVTELSALFERAVS